MSEKKCSERIQDAYSMTMRSIRKLWKKARNGDPDELMEYGLSFNYVEREGKYGGYWQWLLSWGGPSDEFRFYLNSDGSILNVEYWFMDWFDGAHLVLRGPDSSLLEDIYFYLKG